MKLIDVLMDLRVWVISAIIISLLFDTIDVPSSTLIIVVLMIQMTLSMDGLKLSLNDIKENRKDVVISVLMTYALNTLITLAIGAIFIPMNEGIWYGWVILASMPCAIAVVTAAVLTRENIEVSFVGVSATYIIGIVVTPLLSFALIGDAVNPLEILKYLLLFIIIPLILSRPIGKLNLPRTVKVPIINMMMFIMIFLSVNSNRGFLIDDVTFAGIILVVAILRVVALTVLSRIIIRVAKVPNDRRTILTVMGVWKNTGLSVSMSMLLLVSTPESVVPCFMSMMVECIWFSMVTRKTCDDQTA
jgi:BASS family bile acid:Na+ symporter